MMNLRSIVLYPDEGLRKVCQDVPTMTDDIATLVDEMIYCMHNAQGVGLAAPQIGIRQRIFVVDLSDKQNDPRVFINPKLMAQKDDIVWREGCLSIPNVYGEVKRAANVVCEAMDRDGKIRSVEAGELLAVCIQHEMDHLNGKLFIDHLSGLKKRRALKDMKLPEYPHQ